MGNQLKDSSKSQREAWADPTKRRNRLEGAARQHEWVQRALALLDRVERGEVVIVETGNDP